MVRNPNDDRRIVYSTTGGRMCPECGRPVGECVCHASIPAASGDGVARIRREVKGHGGKTVTTISGLPISEDGLRALATELKRQCGTGGTVKGGVIMIQGDHRNTLVALLDKKGYKVKLAGG